MVTARCASAMSSMMVVVAVDVGKSSATKNQLLGQLDRAFPGIKSGIAGCAGPQDGSADRRRTERPVGWALPSPRDPPGHGRDPRHRGVGFTSLSAWRPAPVTG